MTRGQMHRLIWIDAWLSENRFGLQRAHIEEVFDISTAKASLDINLFNRLFPGRLSYDRSAKCYHPADGSQPVFGEAVRSAVFLAGHLVSASAPIFEKATAA